MERADSVSRCDSHFAYLTNAYARAVKKEGAFIGSIDQYIKMICLDVQQAGGLALTKSSDVNIYSLHQECTYEERRDLRRDGDYSTTNVLMLEYDHVDFMAKWNEKQTLLGRSHMPPSERQLSASVKTMEKQNEMEYTTHTIKTTEYFLQLVRWVGQSRSTAFFSDYYKYHIGVSSEDPSCLKFSCKISDSDSDADEAICRIAHQPQNSSAKICNGNVLQTKEKVKYLYLPCVAAREMLTSCRREQRH